MVQPCTTLISLFEFRLDLRRIVRFTKAIFNVAILKTCENGKSFEVAFLEKSPVNFILNCCWNIYYFSSSVVYIYLRGQKIAKVIRFFSFLVFWHCRYEWEQESIVFTIKILMSSEKREEI